VSADELLPVAVAVAIADSDEGTQTSSRPLVIDADTGMEFRGPDEHPCGGS
jgi:hypothetical protein